MLPERRSVGFAYVDHWDNDLDPRHPQKQSVFEEEFQGRGWAALALIPEAPILSAREECWVQGQIDSKALLALAMIVKIPSADAHQLPIDEIYLAEFPIHARQWPNQLAADSNPGSLRASELMADGWRMQPPPGIQLRRLTNTESLKYPGIAGPRHWLIGSGCGRWIYTLMRNQEGIVRLVQVSVQDGSIRWLSENRQSITHPIAIDSASKRISYLVDRNLMIFDLQTGQETQMQWKDQGFEQVIGPVQFLNHSEGLFWNARPTGSPWLQIWTD